MSSTGLEVFDETLHKTNIWLKEIAQALDCDRHRAYQALRAVLHSLRDRLMIDEAAHLGDQLPIYYEAWHPAEKPEKIRSRKEFLAQIDTHFAKVRLIDPECVTGGEIRHVIQELPREIRALWPEAQARSQGVL